VWWAAILTAFAGVPVLRAWWANRRTVLAHSLVWGIAAWLTWVAAAAADSTFALYLALCLTACAGVAVLGARQPGAAAWHAVVAVLLAVLLVPIAEGLGAGAPLPVETLRLCFLGAALVVGLVNYIPTRLGLGALALLAACALELRWLDAEMPPPERAAAIVLAALAPWLGWLGRWAARRAEWEGDRKWRDFRDRHGMVWALRLREQFNRAAAHGELALELRWRGIQRIDGNPLNETERSAVLDLLTALMQRFGDH
jgi:hypothetical protein